MEMLSSLLAADSPPASPHTAAASTARSQQWHQHQHDRGADDDRGDDLRPLMDADGEPYACAENVESAAKFLLASLTNLGLSTTGLDFLSSTPADVATVVNCVHALVQQRARDRAALTTLDDANRRLRFDHAVIQAERSKLEDAMKERYTALGSLEIQVRQAERALQEAKADANARADRDAKLIRQLQGSLHTADVRLRQRDTELAALRQRLGAALSGRGSVGSSASAAASEDGSGHEPTPAPAPHRRNSNNRQSSDAAAAESELSRAKKRAAALATENEGLKARVSELQRDLAQLVSRCEALGFPDAASKQDAAAEGPLSDAELQAYMATGFKEVQARCQALLSRAGAGSGGRLGDATTLTAALRDQDRALSRALASLKRAEAQRDAAQARAAAAQQRVLLLERRLTEALQTAQERGSPEPARLPSGSPSRSELSFASCAPTAARSPPTLLGIPAFRNPTPPGQRQRWAIAPDNDTRPSPRQILHRLHGDGGIAPVRAQP